MMFCCLGFLSMNPIYGQSSMGIYKLAILKIVQG